jgi:hypothetical protein
LVEIETLELASEFQELDPFEFGAIDKPINSTIDELATAIDFSPEPEDLAQERDADAKSMAENFEIQSPFTTIFSALSEVELEPELMESLESLESLDETEGPAPDSAPEARAEELGLCFVGPMFSIPFHLALNGEVVVLEVEDDDGATAVEETEEAPPELAPDEAEEEGDTDTIIAERDGVSYIRESALNPDKETLKGLDKDFKNLIDSILNND